MVGEIVTLNGTLDVVSAEGTFVKQDGLLLLKDLPREDRAAVTDK